MIATFMARLRQEERGSALIITTSIAVVLTLAITVMLNYAVNTQSTAQTTSEFQAALTAAEAGIDDYLYRLNQNDNYWQYSATNPPTADGNRAFTEYVDVPGSPGGGQFTYAIDASQLGINGNLTLRSTGRDGGVDRAVEVLLRRASFLDYIYLTQVESSDPDVYRVFYAGRRGQSADFWVDWAENYCTNTRWASWPDFFPATLGGPPRTTPVWRTGRPPYAGQSATSYPYLGDTCLEIQFASGDVITGPFHTNDRPLVQNGATWLGIATVSAPAPFFVGTTAGAQPNFPNGNFFTHREPIEMPPSNTEVRRQADYTDGAEGCLFTGPTAITFRSNGTMDVRSPYTRQSGPGCGTWPQGTGTALSAVQNVAVPSNGVIYVQNVPTSGPNAWTGTCPRGNGNGLGMPLSGESVRFQGQYGCRSGDVFVQGSYSRPVTIATQNDVFVTRNLVRADTSEGSDDILGLIANNFVNVYHPINTSNVNMSHYGNRISTGGSASVWTNPTIEAAILAVNRGFTVQNYDQGASLGTLRVFGAIAQVPRGAVGLSNGAGVLKDYVYDDRFRFLSPPHFINPVDAQWGVINWAEL